MNNTPIRTSTNGSGWLFISMRIMHRWCWSSSEGCETLGGGRESSVCSVSGPRPRPFSVRTPNFPLITCSTLLYPPSKNWAPACTHFVFLHPLTRKCCTILQPPGSIPLRRSHSISQIFLYSFALNCMIHWTTQDWTVTTLSLYSFHQTECNNYSSNEN